MLNGYMIINILNHSIFKKKPPILIDLGAGGDLKNDWNFLKKYSKIIKIDADKRSISKYYDVEKNQIINKIITPSKEKNIFYYTQSSFCSSILKPNQNELKNWSFNKKFKVLKKKYLETTTLSRELNIKKIEYIDWIKFDLQGIDLTIFKSIPNKIRSSIIAAEFEPGIYEFYKNENTPSEIFKFMYKDFYIEEIDFGKGVKGNSLIQNKLNFLQKKLLNKINKKTKIYMNIFYLRKNISLTKKNLRQILLFLCILINKKRYLEVLEICSKCKKIDPIFNSVENYIFNKINISFFYYLMSVPLIAFRKLKNFLLK
jgi:hypothetical protein